MDTQKNYNWSHVLCSKQALLEQQHQMVCINSDTVRFQLTSSLRNGRFQPGITRTIGDAFLLYAANIKFEIHKKYMDTQKNYNWSHVLCSKQALLEQQHQMVCINSETVRFQLTPRIRNGRFQPGITRTIGDAFFLYSALLDLKYIKKYSNK